MKRHGISALLVGLAACLLFQTGGSAGGKKDDKRTKGTELTYNSELAEADVKDKVRTGSYAKIYSYKMTAGKTYQIDMKSIVIDSYLRLEDSKGQEVAKDDDSGGNLDARIVYQAPKTEDYQIYATTFGSGATGKFTLTVKELVLDKNAGKPIELRNDKGNADYKGTLAATDSLYNGKKHKLFLFNMDAGKTYQIDMKSNAIDSYLFLESPDGQVLAKDDDSGGNLDARIIHKAAVTGKHRIIATCFGSRSAGDFTLTIRETE